MSRIPPYQSPHFEIGAPSTLSRLGQGLFRVAALVSVLALAYFALKALMKYSSERELRPPGAEGASPKPQNLSDLTSEEFIMHLVETAKDRDYKAFEKAYLILMTEEQAKFGAKIISMKQDLFNQLRADLLFENVLENSSADGLLREHMLEDRQLYPSGPAPVPSAPPLHTLPGYNQEIF